MHKLVLGGVLFIFLSGAASAQSYCPQVRQAVATYGYEAAKRYAIAHYTPEQIRAAQRCLSGSNLRRRVASRSSD